MPKGDHPADPRGLIYEAYRMDPTQEECRAIFLDWALGRPEGDGRVEIAALLDRYGREHPDHPMTALLRQGLEATRPRGRRRRDR